MMAKLLLLSSLAGAAALLAAASSAAQHAGHDASALVQGSLRAHWAGEERAVKVSDRVTETPEGPFVQTKYGAIRGKDKGDHLLFGAVKYVETPERFEVGKPLRRWAPRVYNATDYGPACIGAAIHLPESEDCLHLNIWMPKGGLTNLPVIVYIHGGMQQHGSGSEQIRRGDGIVLSKKHPVIFVNFDYRLGIFGWISLPGSNVTSNLGLLDQQAAMRWVHENIAAFGGDPGRVTLQGQSEGSATVLAHLVSPGSEGLFQRCSLHSPVADFWRRSTNQDRTRFIVQQLGCQRLSMRSTVECLKGKPAQAVWGKDWVPELIVRDMGSPQWFEQMGNAGKFLFASADLSKIATGLGWHPVVDGTTLPGEPRELIAQGKFHKVQVLMTVSKNETWGVIPGGSKIVCDIGLTNFLAAGKLGAVKQAYRKSLEAQGIRGMDETVLANLMLTDKLFTCDARNVARELAEGGSQVYVGMFWHSPRWDPVGASTTPACSAGSMTCHAAEMLYVLPQRGGWGVKDQKLPEEQAFSEAYMDSYLTYVYGEDGEHPWKAWDSSEPITFYDRKGTRVVPGYRREQCAVLDRSVGFRMPPFMHKLAARLSATATAKAS